MNVTLPPEVEQAYLAEAQAKGVPIDDVVRDVLIAMKPVVPAELSPEEWVREFKAWTRSHSTDNLPILSDEAMSRDSIYGDRGL